ncbi:GNAT family N-acetyltransferase [Pelagicoccus mobilis]|uniref:GNAT family N-acetyltransferase n=1 Tax=Pelagicoccus mobilis TaxID=415221 RepID=A0A934VTH5_9BACT|nr:GNAT family N-acetyltransferase [Pelagicoccus mobilis]MBK1879529.1 GNAT family N-acetyltransferase [Pelagicoccus mobilis]
MNSATPAPSIASIRDTIGLRAGRHFELAMRHCIDDPKVVKNESYIRILTGEPNPLGNLAAIATSTDNASIAEIAKTYRSISAPSAFVFVEAIDETVRTTLESHGFSDTGGMPAMAVDIDTVKETKLPDGYAWKRIGTETEAKKWTSTLALGYDLPVRVAELFSPERYGDSLLEHESLQFWAVYWEDKPVATSMLFLADGLAGIYCIATLPDHRKKGIGAFATAQPLKIAKACGYSVGVLQSSEAGHSVYLGLGFSDYALMPMYLRIPS